STMITGDFALSNDFANSTVKILLPTIKVPGLPSIDRFNFLANHPMENPWATTVKNTRPNVNHVKIETPAYPSSPNSVAKYPATVSATIPLGAIQPTKAFSFNDKFVPMVDKKIDRGLTANIINST